MNFGNVSYAIKWAWKMGVQKLIAAFFVYRFVKFDNVANDL